MAQALERRNLSIGEALQRRLEDHEEFRYIQDVQNKIACLEKGVVQCAVLEMTSLSSERAKLLLNTITRSLDSQCNSRSVAEALNMISAIARQAPKSQEASMSCENLMEQGVAVTIASKLLCMKRGHGFDGSNLPDTLVAAADLARVSSEMRVRLQKASILENAAIALNRVQHTRTREAATVVLQALTQSIVEDPACAHIYACEPTSTSMPNFLQSRGPSSKLEAAGNLPNLLQSSGPPSKLEAAGNLKSSGFAPSTLILCTY